MTTARTIHISAFDPDFRRAPKTNDFCFRCQKDLKPGQARRWLTFVTNMEVAHPADLHLVDENSPAYCGMYPVGADCARTMKNLTGDEWTIALPEAPTNSNT
jgi:hypothetical protein